MSIFHSRIPDPCTCHYVIFLQLPDILLQAFRQILCKEIVVNANFIGQVTIDQHIKLFAHSEIGKE